MEAVLPANAGTTQVVYLNSVSCPSPGNCVAGGVYSKNSEDQAGLLLTETAGRWGPGIDANPPTGAIEAFVSSVSCPSRGNCSAVGEFRDSSGARQGLLLTETAGTWAPGIKLTLPAGAGTNPMVSLGAVSCAAPGDCAAVGNYTDSFGDQQGLLVAETAGTWRPGVKVSLPAGAGADPRPSVNSVSCPSPGNCAAVGYYIDGSDETQGLLLREVSGTWAAENPEMPPGAATIPGPQIYAVSCASAGNCTAVGNYADSSGHEQGLLLTESSGAWSPGVAASLPADVGPSPNVYFQFHGVSCTAPGDCSAIGEYETYLGVDQILLLTQTGGTWATGVEASLPANAPSNPGVLAGSISCSSPGECSAVSGYDDNAHREDGVLLTETSGTWTAGVEVSPPANAASNPSVYPTSISCSSAGNCSAVAYYEDSSENEQGLLLDTQHTLTVSRLGAGAGTVAATAGGIDCGGACSFSYTEGNVVTLTATPSPGSAFAGWSGGGCSGLAPCAVEMSSDQAVTATFDATAPVLSSLQVAPARFMLIGRQVKGRCVKATRRNLRDRRCTRRLDLKISYRLSSDASVRVMIVHVLSGRVADGRCVRVTRRNRRHRRCVRLVALRGALTENGIQGANSFTFTGRIGGHKLTAGSYRLTATPSLGAGTGTQHTIAFTIVA